jgi:exopolyphosphatase/guanosine-5'-triphosphate,3'-diphosphate pyrophosphatase
VGRWAALQLSTEISGPVAAIDCGTNSTRLLVIDRQGVAVERLMTITRLGQDVDRTHCLAAQAIERTLTALGSYREVMDRHGVVAVRAVATSAARDADNAEEFFSRAGEVIGVEPELLDGPSEGRLSYRGATSDLDAAAGPYLVVDLGGGSTELVAGDEHHDIAAVVSTPVGCVRITERFLSSDPPTEDELEAARSYVAEVLTEAFDAHPALLAPPSMVGVAGTVATLVTLDAGDADYDAAHVHHWTLTRTALEQHFRSLAGETVEQRRHHRGVEAARADVIVAGALVLATVMDAVGASQLVYSERDILDGVAAELRDRRS